MPSGETRDRTVSGDNSVSCSQLSVQAAGDGEEDQSYERGN